MIKIVTDSTADIPLELAEENGILVIPAILTFGMQSFRDGIDITKSEFYLRLVTSPTLPTTSQPSVGEFAEAYEQAAAEADQVLAIHLGSAFSGLFETAQLTVQMHPDLPVTLFDSGLVTMGCGILALEAAHAASQGASLDEILAMLNDARPRTYVNAALDTLEYLRRGGRLSRISATIGRLLSVRPVIEIHENELLSVARTRHRENSLRRLLKIVESRAPLERLYAVHAADPETADWLAERAAHLNSGDKPAIIEAGSVVGTHAGPRAVGFAYMRKP
jgi:DegV family protein with EDD domain